MPGPVVQVAGLARPSHAASRSAAQEHHDSARRGHRLLGHGHHAARFRRLGHDAVVLRLQLHARAREAGEERQLSAVLRHRATHWHAQASRAVRLQARVERQAATLDLGGHHAIHSRRRAASHQQLRLSCLRHGDRAAIRRRRQLGHQCHYFAKLITHINTYIRCNFLLCCLLFYMIYICSACRYLLHVYACNTCTFDT